MEPTAAAPIAVQLLRCCAKTSTCQVDFLVTERAAREKAKERITKAGDGGAGVIGATKQDLDNLGVDRPQASSRNLHEEAKKKGGSLSMKDLMDMGGY